MSDRCILVVYARSKYSEWAFSPSPDVLTSTGVRPVGWMAMYVVIISRNSYSDPDIGFSAVLDVKCLDRPWWSCGQTLTVPLPCPNALVPAMSCPPSIPTRRVLLPSSNPRAMYELHLSSIPMVLDLMNSSLSYTRRQLLCQSSHSLCPLVDLLLSSISDIYIPGILGLVSWNRKHHLGFRDHQPWLVLSQRRLYRALG